MGLFNEAAVLIAVCIYRGWATTKWYVAQSIRYADM